MLQQLLIHLLYMGLRAKGKGFKKRQPDVS